MTGFRIVHKCIIAAAMAAMASAPLQAAPRYYYYADNNQIALDVRTNVISVSFVKGITDAQKDDIAARFTVLSDPDRWINFRRVGITQIPFREDTPLALVESTINALRSMPLISWANPTFEIDGAMYVVSDRFIVKFLPDLARGVITTLNERQGVEVIAEPDWGPNTFILRTTKETGSSALEMANFYHNLPQVDYAEPDFLVQVKPVTNDTYYSTQWFLNNSGGYPYYGTPDADIDAPEAWNITTGDTGIVVAIIDDGLQISHPDLNDHVEIGYDGVDGDSDPTPNSWDGHGTSCAGLAAAETNNSLGVASIGYNCHVMGCRIFYSEYSGGPLIGYISWITGGIYYARDHADVMSCSWTMSSPSSNVTTAFNNAHTNGRSGLGSIICCATGNDNANDIDYPAELSCNIAVGATNEDDDRCDPGDWGPGQGSNYGAEIDVVAPGKWQTTTDYTGGGGYAGGDYTIAGDMGTFGGTSGATPVVAGVAALVLSVDPTLTATEVQGILQATADDLVGDPAEDIPGWDQYMGWGRVNAASAVDSVSESFPPPENLDAGDGYDSHVPLNWDPPSRTLSYYRIYRSTVGASGPFNVIDSTSSTTYDDYNVINGVTYWYTLKAIYVSPSGESGISNVDDGTPEHYFAPPTNLVAEDGYDSEVPVHWDSPGGDILRFRIYRSVYDSTYGFVLYDSSVTTSYTDVLVVNGNTYWYKATAVYNTPPGESDYSNVDAGTPEAPPFPPPQSLSAFGGLDSRVYLDWYAPARTLSHYRIYRSEDGEFGTYAVLDSTSDTEYDDYNVVNGHMYWYKLKAIYTSPSGESVFSNVADAQPGLPNQPPVIVHDPMHDSDIPAPTLTADVTDDYSENIVVFLYYRQGGGGFSSMFMTSSGYGDQYMATMPEMAQGIVDYYIAAGDDSGSTSYEPTGAPSVWHSFDVGDIGGDEIAYDDGGWEYATYTEHTSEEWAVKFSPPVYPYYLKGALISQGHGWPDESHERFVFTVYDDDGPDYMPQTVLLGPDTTGSIGNEVGDMEVLDRGATHWAPIVIRDSTDSPLVIEDGDFFISVKNLGDTPMESFNRDSSGWSAPSRSYFYDACVEGWYSEDDTLANENARRSNRMIRALGGTVAQVSDLWIEREDSTSIRLTWNDNGSPFYSIYSDTSSGGSFDNQMAVLPDTTYIDIGVVTGHSIRYYQVRGSLFGSWGN